jgi:two-component system response regulator RegX3
MNERVLLADGSPEVRRQVAAALRRACFEVEDVRDGEAALTASLRAAYDVVVLDLYLQRVPGTDVLRRIRAVSSVPIIVVNEHDSEAERVLSLEVGADDYLAKPFSVLELVSRVRALLRRCELERQSSRGPIRSVGGIVIDLGLREVVVDDRPVYLTDAQFKLLTLLSEEPGHVVTRSEILNRLWHSAHTADAHVCDVHVSNLRAKVERDRRHPERIVTVRGRGYRLLAV